MKRLIARVKNSNATRRLLMPFVLRWPTLPRRLVTLAQRFSRDITHPDWPAPLPAAYRRLPVQTRKVLLDLARTARQQAAPAASSQRKRLAWVAPHRPDAGESLLLTELARHYDIDLVILDQDAGAAADCRLTARSGAWFERHHETYARVLYHVANSAAHRPVLRLLAHHPGIVVLHDFFLGEAVAGLPHTVYHAHGYSGLLAWRELGEAATLAAFPLNRGVFDQADGVIVDVANGAAMTGQALAWYGPRYASSVWMTGAHAGDFAAAIEDIVASSAAARYRQSLLDAAASGIAADPRDRSLIAAAAAIAASHPAPAPRQLLVDISAVAQNDLKTGVQRVVRSILLALIKDPPAGFRVEPIYGSGLQQQYRYARRFTLDLLGFHGIAAEDDPIAYQDGDIFLCPDLAKYTTLTNLDTFDDMHARGVAVYFVVHDILPLLQPHVFPYGAPQHFKQYILAIAQHADGAVCVSRAVADELGDWLDIHAAPGARRARPFKIGYFHHGADLDASAPSSGMPADAAHVLASLAARPSFLMVGTLEPRKSHAQALAAFDLLWQNGVDVNLVIVGKQGWMVDSVVMALGGHPQLGKRLFWLHGVSDQMLTEAYRLSSALLAASTGEGFGLPLIEAAQHGLAIIARDIPVFREVCGTHAYYFDGMAPEKLADAIDQWLDLFRRGCAPGSAAMPWLTWSRSAQQLLDTVVREQWYRILPSKRL